MSGEAQSGPSPEGVPQSHQSVPVELSEGEFESWRVHAVVSQQSEAQGIPAKLIKEGPSQLGLLLQIGIPALTEAFKDSGIPLSGDGDEGPLVSVQRPLQFPEAKPALIRLALNVFTAAGLIAADGADAAGHTAPDADFFFDTCLNLANEVRVFLRAQHISPALQPAVRVTRGGKHSRFPDDLRPIDPGSLIFCGPLVVKDSGFSEHQVSEVIEVLPPESLKIPVDFVIAKPDGERVDLVIGELGFCELVNQRKVIVIKGIQDTKPPSGI